MKKEIIVHFFSCRFRNIRSFFNLRDGRKKETCRCLGYIYAVVANTDEDLPNFAKQPTNHPEILQNLQVERPSLSRGNILDILENDSKPC